MSMCLMCHDALGSGEHNHHDACGEEWDRRHDAELCVYCGKNDATEGVSGSETWCVGCAGPKTPFYGYPPEGA